MNFAAKMRQAGFELSISKRGGLLIEPASKLTAEQRSFIKLHKVVLLAELRHEQEPATEAEPPPRSAPLYVCCGDCQHSVLPPSTDAVYGWRTCGLGVEGGGGFGRENRRCEQFAHRAATDSPSSSPLEARITELVADGWSPWNAKAKAEGEAREARKAGVEAQP